MSAESCLVFPSSRRDEGMGPDSSSSERMGLSREAVVESEMKGRNSLHHHQQQLQPSQDDDGDQSHMLASRSSLSSSSPRQITDSDNSECTKRNGEEKKEKEDDEHAYDDLSSSNENGRPLSAFKRRGETIGEPSSSGQESRSSSANAMKVDDSETLPQHERLSEQFAILDISYQSTPGSVEIKNKLIQRLNISAPSGTLQVVS
jgi:hypothetical protein